MSVKKEESGKRSIQVEVEVPGTPEEVWEAIATGPGISCWFTRTEMEGGEGDQISFDMGGGMQPAGKVTKWDPPRSFAGESKPFGPEAPTVGVEWFVESRSGDTCVVRVVHSLFADTDDWDKELESIEQGWPGFFGILRVYLEHFRGRPCSILRVLQPSAGTQTSVWERLMDGLGLAGVAEGASWTSAAGAAPLAGVVAQRFEGEHPKAVVRLTEPGPGVALLNTFTMAGSVFVGFALYLYGDDAAETVERDQGPWQAWIQEQFAAVSP